MSKPIIKVENISKCYLIGHEVQQGMQYKRFSEALLAPFRKKGKAAAKEEFWALKDINFEVEPGDRIGVIGRNGAGKSTLLKVLSKITAPTTGRISINGRIASLLEVGTGFHPELTGRENIFLNGAILGMKRAEIRRKFDEIVDFAGVEKFLDTPVKRYSSGMYVRLAFAVAAHLEPEILVIDEVLAVGDAEFQKKCLGKMDEISKTQGRTILFVSHNMTAVRQLCNKGILLNQGHLISTGSAEDTISGYLNNNTSEFCNSVEFDLSEKKSDIRIKKLSLFKNGVLSDGYYCAGDKLSIEIETDCRSNERYGVFVWLYNELNELFASSSSAWMFDLEYVGNRKIIWHLDTTPLVRGKYFFNIELHSPCHPYDEIKYVFPFEITGNNISQNGFEYCTHYNNRVYLPNSWEEVK